MTVSFDFDLSLAHSPFVQKLFMSMSSHPGFEPHIVTQRYGPAHPNDESEEVFELALRLGIPANRIHFTNRLPKWPMLRAIRAVMHVDDDMDQLRMIHAHCPDCMTHGVFVIKLAS
jgi:hypothetical protein